MLKKIYIKKLILCSIVLFAILLVYMIPDSDKKFEKKEIVNYVNKDVKTSTIFLLDSNNLLASTKIITTKTDVIGKAKELLEALIIDSSMQDNIPNGFKPIIPNNTEILNISYDNNLIKVDFSKELMNTSKDKEEKIIEAIVYTLTNIEGVDNIIIYNDGEVLTKLPKSSITLPSTLNRDIGINKEYNITNKNNISKTTIYYISKYNDNTYYVPVTKVNNDQRSKIEIIIDELNGNNVYKPNLMSYLNNNTKILSADQKDNELVINFNNSILNDMNTKEILEEVIYTISMSINDNYDVDMVIFDVENKEIYKSVLKSIE